MNFSHRPSMILAGLLFLHSVSLTACAGQHFLNTGSSGSRATPQEAQRQTITRHSVNTGSSGSRAIPQEAHPTAARHNVNIGSSGSRVTPQEAQQIVALHNRIRAQVGVGPVRWSAEVAAYAQQWADHLASTRCGMEHRPRSGRWQQEYGENLFIGTAGHYGTSDAVMAWAGEKSNYRGGAIQASRIADIGHYTQMVWRDTTRIGCATAVCNKWLIVVCNYDPRGNYLGQSPY